MTDRNLLRGKGVVITGAVGILGKFFSEAFAAHGANVCLVDLDARSTESYAKELEERFGIKSLGTACDITKPTEVDRLVRDATLFLGSLDILHNNAASKSNDLTRFFDPFEEYSLETWKEVMEVNINAMFLMAQAVGKIMVQRGRGGSIIQTSSIYGVVAPDQRIYEGSEYLGRAINTPAVYSTSKAAVIGLTQYLATYWAPQNIRVNTLTPGGIESGQNETFRQKYSNRVPLGRMGKPEELLGALLFLASDASSYVTGQNIIVDGGLSVW